MCRKTTLASLTLVAMALTFGLRAHSQAPSPIGPAPTSADIAYAAAEPADSKGHLLDLFIPANAQGTSPVVIWTGGSAWRADTGKARAGIVAAELNKAGFAVAGVSIRSSSQVKFPGQLHDIKAAIRWLRSNAAKYKLDPQRIAIIGDSSGGWTAAMAAVTGDVFELEGRIGTTGVSSAVQAAVAFFPPTDFLLMDQWALKPCSSSATLGPGGGFCHNAATSPESLLIGCAIQSCPDKVRLANPVRYISANDPPIMILHGQSDALVPHNQGELFYQALNKVCHESVFISLPKAGHGPAQGFLTDDAVRTAATIRSTTTNGCAVLNPAPFTPTWAAVIGFLRTSLK